MKNILYILSFLFMLCSISSAGECTAKLTIHSNISESTIYLNNKCYGNGSITAELPKGIYNLQIKESVVEWNSQIIKDTIEITNCDTEIVRNYSFAKNVLLNSLPQDAEVFKGDSLLGSTPLLLNYKSGELLLHKNNYDNKSVILQSVDLTKPVELNFSGRVKNGSFINSHWFRILIGTSVALGATAAYFKIKADKEYDKYLSTKDRGYLDNTDSNDLISGIAFGALQINFGILIYYFLTD